MDEYTDLRKRRHKVIQRVKEHETTGMNKEFREEAEREIVEALFRILNPKEESENEENKQKNSCRR